MLTGETTSLQAPIFLASKINKKKSACGRNSATTNTTLKNRLLNTKTISVFSIISLVP